MNEIDRVRAAYPRLADTAAPAATVARIDALIADASAGARRGRRRDRVVPGRRIIRTAVLVVLAVLALAAVALAARAWLFGTPVAKSPPLPAPAGRFLPGTAKLLSLRVPDPDGGPPWGMRVSTTSGAFGCVQAGRVVNGRLVALGIDGSFHNDGRAHALPVESDGCGGVDDVGHVRASGSPSITTASGATTFPSCAIPGQLNSYRLSIAEYRRQLRHPTKFDTPSILRSERRSARRFSRILANPPKACPARTLRTILLGVLGPDAAQVTLTGASRRPIVRRVAPSDGGAYLFVVRGSELELRPGSALTKLRLAVRYRNGLQCPLIALTPTPDPSAPPACSKTPPGYIYRHARPSP